MNKTGEYIKRGQYCVADAYLLCKDAFPNATVSLHARTVAVEMPDGRKVSFLTEAGFGHLKLTSDNALLSDLDKLVSHSGGGRQYDDQWFDVEQKPEPVDRIERLIAVGKKYPESGAVRMVANLEILSRLGRENQHFYYGFVPDADLFDALEREHKQGHKYGYYMVSQDEFESWSEKDGTGHLKLPVYEDVTATSPVADGGNCAYADWHGEKGRIRFNHDDGEFVDVFANVLPMGIVGRYLAADPSCLAGNIILAVPESDAQEVSEWVSDLRKCLTENAVNLSDLIDKSISQDAATEYADFRHAPIVVSVDARYKARNRDNLVIPVESLEAIGEQMDPEPSSASEVLRHLLAAGLPPEFVVKLDRDIYGRARNDDIVIRSSKQAPASEAIRVSLSKGFEKSEEEDLRTCNSYGYLAVCVSSKSDARPANVMKAVADTLEVIDLLKQAAGARDMKMIAWDIRRKNEREDRAGDPSP